MSENVCLKCKTTLKDCICDTKEKKCEYCDNIKSECTCNNDDYDWRDEYDTGWDDEPDDGGKTFIHDTL